MAKISKRKSKQTQSSLNITALAKPDYNEAEIAARRDAGLRRLLSAPPKPHAEVSGAKAKQVKKPKPRPRKG